MQKYRVDKDDPWRTPDELLTVPNSSPFCPKKSSSDGVPYSAGFVDLVASSNPETRVLCDPPCLQMQRLFHRQMAETREIDRARLLFPGFARLQN